MQNDFFSKTSFLSDFSWISRNFRKFASILKAFRQKTQLWNKKKLAAGPPQTYFLGTKRTESLIDALQITQNHRNFSERKKVCQSKNAWGKYCYFVAKTFPRGAACVFESSFWGIFGPIWTRIPSNPLFFDHFGVQLNTFSESFGIVSRCTISTVSSNHKFSCFWTSNRRGASVEILTFEHFGVQLSTFLTLLESSPGAQYQHFHSNHQILMFLNIECRGGLLKKFNFLWKNEISLKAISLEE